METSSIVMTRGEARDLYRAYKKHKHWSTPVDREVQRAYQLLSQGRLVIKGAGIDPGGRARRRGPAEARHCAGRGATFRIKLPLVPLPK